MYKKLTHLFFFGLILSPFAYGHSQDVHTRVSVCSELLEGFDPIVNEVLQEFNVPGMAIGVVVDGEVVLARGYGVKNVSERAPVTEETLFPIASCTKAFTAFILGQLVDEGVISWDDPVITYLPEFQLFDKHITCEVTIRDLVAHRTGIPRHDLAWFARKIGQADLLKSLRYLEPVSELRKKWHYNNAMYAVIGMLIERVTGQTWREACSSRIFSPLKMSNSNLCIDELQNCADFSRPYAEIDGVIEKIPFRSLDFIGPCGGINSNIGDMLKWVQMHLSEEETLIKKKTWEEMTSLQIPFFSNERDGLGISHLGYGLGWYVGTYRDHDVISHRGLIDGFNSEVLLLPKKNSGIVILSNSSSDGIFAIASLRNTLLDRLLDAPETDWISSLQAKHGKLKQLLKLPKKQEETVPSHSLQDYVGDYENPAYGKVRVYLKGNQLFISYGEVAIALDHEKENLFKGQIRYMLIFSVRRIVDCAFQSHSADHFDEVHISFEPEAKPLIFKRKV